MFNRKMAVVRTKKYGKLIRISVIFVVIAIAASLIAYGWQQYEEEKYPEGTEKDYSLPNAFLDFASLINDFMTQNEEPEEVNSENEDPKSKEDEKDNIIIVGSGEPESEEEPSEISEPEEPEIRGGIVPEKDNAGFYSFKDSLFVGDYFLSQVHSLGYFDNSKFAYTTDLDMNTMLTKKVIKTEEGYVTLTDYVETFTDKEVEAVYIVISAESVSWMDVPTFVKKYTTFVEGIVSVYPEAHIYVQPIFPINEEKAAKRGYSVTNEKIRQINEYIFSFAEENSIWILDMYEEFADKNGMLPAEYTTNGIRFEKDTYGIWSSYIVTHKAH